MGDALNCSDPRHTARLTLSDLLAAVRAQVPAVETLRRSLATERVHHAYVFDGPDGVGKELTAWGLAQALVCQQRRPGEAAACGVCSACQRAVPHGDPLAARHPDVVVIERGLYDPSAIGRRSPEAQEISIDQVRTVVLARAAFPPSEGRAKVFIVRRAEELGQAAANALLKTLEEPGPRTYFVLVTSVLDALLPTIRSRTQRLRFGTLPDVVVTSLLQERGIPQAAATAVAPFATGSMSQALRLSDPQVNEERQSFISAALTSLTSADLGPALDLAEVAKKFAKPDLVAHLDAFAAAIAIEGRQAGKSGVLAKADLASVRFSMVLETIRQIEGNASPQLAMEALMVRMRAV